MLTTTLFLSIEVFHSKQRLNIFRELLQIHVLLRKLNCLVMFKYIHGLADLL